MCSDLNIAEPITTASNIVTGSDPELTNILLQQLAVSLYWFQNKEKLISDAKAFAGSDDATATQAQKDEERVIETVSNVSIPTWVQSANISLSEDGMNWSVHSQTYDTGLRDEHSVAVIKLLPHSSDVNPCIFAKYVKITPTKWNSSSGENGPAMRVDVKVFDKKGSGSYLAPCTTHCLT